MNNEGGGRGMAKEIGFPRVLKKEHVEIPRSVKKAEFPGVFKKKSCGISMRLGFCHSILQNFQWEWVVTEGSGKYIFTPPYLHFFWKSPMMRHFLASLGIGFLETFKNPIY